MAKKLADWLQDNGYGALQHLEPVSGGSISASSRIHLNSGETLFLKQNTNAPHDMFAAEAAGLAALASSNSLRVPAVVHFEPQFIVLEDLGHSAPSGDYWEEFADGLAKLHRQHAAQFGFTTRTYCGATPQDNSPQEDGARFFGECRLLALARLALNNKLISNTDFAQTENIVARLQQWIPRMPAVLLHWDLWSGNAHCTDSGQAALIDPACYWGWAEAELAMTDLFGGFPEAFYSHYKECSDLADDWRERVPLYNLYHLLNHLILFGSSYYTPVKTILNRFADC